ncbi:MAG: 4Fe-4S binding protein, partial [Deltaproteobacteria bacterium]|nr:4Fe-4S binding protein [Deltaproteobacteria bacterium]
AVHEADAAAGAVRYPAAPGSLGQAIGRAVAGERVTVWLVDAAQAAAPLREASRRHVALLAVCRDPGTTDDLAPRDVAAVLAGDGVAVLRASTAQEAYDATVLGRWLTEAALRPVLVVLTGGAASDAAEAWHAVAPEVVRDWLGSPSDEVDAATAAQGWVFGRQRARVVARWDAAHPVAVGQTIDAADRRAAAESAELWFDGAWAALAATGGARWRALAGRDLTHCVAPPPAAQANRRARTMAGHSAYPQRELLIEAVRRTFPDAVAGKGATSVQMSAPADPWLQGALRQRAEREGSPADCGSLARLWGEYVSPRAAGEGQGELNPWLAAATTPAASAVLFDRSAGRAQLPAVDVARCTGCGDCWAACPDAALASVALGTQAWLDAAAVRAQADGLRGSGADRSKRLHKAVAQQIDDAVHQSAATTVTADTADAAFARAADKANLHGDERAAAQAAWRQTLAEALRLPPATTATLFHGPHQRQRGSGLVLHIAVDPRACQGCGLCAEVCKEGAIALHPQQESSLQAARGAWLAWDRTPDTTGPAMAAAQAAGLDPLAALLLSRHANHALCGADFSPAGSGQRLAVRLATAVAEQRRGPVLLQRARALQDLSDKLDEATRSVFAAAAPTGDPQALLDALDSATARTAPLGAIADRLAVQGLGTSLDVARLRRLAEAAGLVAAARHRLTRAGGWGQARYGVVVAGATVAAWAGQFPRNPFTGPALVDTTDQAFDVAVGLAAAERAHAVAEAKAARTAELALGNAADADLRLQALADLRPEDLTDVEATAALPVLVVGDCASLQGAGLAGLGRALASGLAVHVLYLRDAEGDPPVDAVRFARAVGDLAVASTSPAHRDHLYSCLVAAFDGRRPSLTSVLALSAIGDGFSPEALLARTAAAVDCGDHPLLRFAPGQPTETGLAVAVEAARQQAAATHRAELDLAMAELRAAHADDLQAARLAWQAEALQRLRDQLVQLARSAPPRPSPSDPEAVA